MSLNQLSDFMKVLYSIRKNPIKNEHFPMDIIFTTIYLLQENN
jgi:hypothetical protein